MSQDETVISLRDYLLVLRRHVIVIVLTVVVVVGIGVTRAMLESPLYRTDTELLIDPVRRAQDVAVTPAGLRDEMQTERLVITSLPVVERAAEATGIPAGTIAGRTSTEVVGATRVVRVSVVDRDPARAATIANAVADAYLEHRREAALDNMIAARRGLEQRTAELREQITRLDEAIAGAAEEERPALVAERDGLLGSLVQITAQSAEVGDAAQVLTGGGEVLRPAEVRPYPVSPRPHRTALLALMLGTVLGVGLAFLRDHLDDEIRDDDDVKRATGGRPLLGRVPHWVGGEGTAGERRLVTLVEPHSVVAEAYREMSTNVRFLLAVGQDENVLGRVVTFTSAGPEDGKSSSAANLAVVAARSGQRVVLVDADLRRPTIASWFGLVEGPGLSEVLREGSPIEQRLRDVGVENLSVLTSGEIPPNPTELLGSPRMASFLHDLRRRFGLVVMDSAPVLAVADALELGRLSDVTVLIARARRSHRRSLAAVVERFATVGVEVGGTVLNDLSSRSDYEYYYRYEYLPRASAVGGSTDTSNPPPPPAYAPSSRRWFRRHTTEHEWLEAKLPGVGANSEVLSSHPHEGGSSNQG